MKGILFKAWKAEAIRLSGADRQWQTRRALPYQPSADAVAPTSLAGAWGNKPRYHPGETVYVKERYDPGVWPDCKAWKSPLFMPASAARTLLLITSVRVEKTRDISWQDCIAEGVVQSPQWLDFDYQPPENLRPSILTPDEAEAELDRAWQEYVRQAYWALYNSINGAGAHERNWDWVYEFRRVEGDHIVDANKMVGDNEIPCSTRRTSGEQRHDQGGARGSAGIPASG